jgi:hypothetical protein
MSKRNKRNFLHLLQLIRSENTGQVLGLSILVYWTRLTNFELVLGRVNEYIDEWEYCGMSRVWGTRFLGLTRQDI